MMVFGLSFCWVHTYASGLKCGESSLNEVLLYIGALAS